MTDCAMGLSDLHQLSAIIDTIYQGVTDANAWHRVMPQIAHWLGANQAVLFTPFTPPQLGGFVVPHGMTQATIEAWAQAKHADDLWSQRGAQRGMLMENRIVVDQDLATEEELRASTWYRDFLHAQNIARLMCGVVFGSDHPDVICTAMSLYRSWSDPAFDAEAKERFSLLMPHMSRALGLMLTLRGEEMRVACTQAALNRLNVGVALIAADESITFANHAAERLFRQSDGLGLRDAMGSGRLRLNIWHDASREAVRLALRAALDRDLQVAHFNQKIHVPRPSGKPPYAIQLSSCTDAWAAGAVPGAPCAVLLAVDPDQRFHIDPESLRQLHGLTSTEARVAIALLDDISPESLADSFGVQPSTVRTHIAKLYEKFGVNSRASLVRILLSHAEP